MTRLLLLVSSAEGGYFAEDALAAHERFTAAGLDVVVATPDGEPPTIDPVSLEPVFHQFEEDADFLAGVIRSFAPDPEDVRITLEQLSDLDVIAARRICEELHRAGWPDDEARRKIEALARTAWLGRRNLVELLAADEDVTAAVPAEGLRRLAAELRRDGAREAAATAERLAAIPAFQKPARLGEVTDQEHPGFDGMFVPGGHGPLTDLASNPDVGRLLHRLHAGGRVIATVSQGAAALLSAGGRPDGAWLFDGFRLVGLTHDEEAQMPLGPGTAPWTVEEGLKNAGAVFDAAPDAWTAHIVVDRNLITAQNPMSAGAAIDAVLKSFGVYEATSFGGADPIRSASERLAAPAELVRLFFDRLDRHDLDGALALVDPAAEVELLPVRLSGMAGVEGRAFLENLVSAFPDLVVRSRNVFACGDGTVIAEIVVEGTQAADFYGILNQRKHVDVRQAWVLSVADGQVRRLRAYWCQNQLYRRLGVRRLDGVG
jgi:putative intracellular protease/amidase/ketosteroid isomerase-like protein